MSEYCFRVRTNPYKPEFFTIVRAMDRKEATVKVVKELSPTELKLVDVIETGGLNGRTDS